MEPQRKTDCGSSVRKDEPLIKLPSRKLPRISSIFAEIVCEECLRVLTEAIYGCFEKESRKKARANFPKGIVGSFKVCVCVCVCVGGGEGVNMSLSEILRGLKKG